MGGSARSPVMVNDDGSWKLRGLTFSRASHLVKFLFNVWREVTRHNRAWRMKCIAACKFKIERIDAARKLDVFERWRDATVRGSVLRSEAEEIDGGVVEQNNQLLAEYLFAWSRAVIERRKRTSLKQQAHQFRDFHLLLKGFNGWRLAHSTGTKVSG